MLGFSRVFYVTETVRAKTWSNEHNVKKKKKSQNQDFAPRPSISLPPELIQCKSQCSDRDLCLQSAEQLTGAKAVCILCMFSYSVLSLPVDVAGQCMCPFCQQGVGSWARMWRTGLSLWWWGMEVLQTILLVLWEGCSSPCHVSSGDISCCFWWRISQFGFLQWMILSISGSRVLENASPDMLAGVQVTESAPVILLRITLSKHPLSWSLKLCHSLCYHGHVLVRRKGWKSGPLWLTAVMSGRCYLFH